MTEEKNEVWLLASIKRAVGRYVRNQPPTYHAGGGWFRVVGVLSVRHDINLGYHLAVDCYVTPATKDSHPLGVPPPGVSPADKVVEYILHVAGDPEKDLVVLVWAPDSVGLARGLQALQERRDALIAQTWLRCSAHAQDPVQRAMEAIPYTPPPAPPRPPAEPQQRRRRGKAYWERQKARQAELHKASVELQKAQYLESLGIQLEHTRRAWRNWEEANPGRPWDTLSFSEQVALEVVEKGKDHQPPPAPGKYTVLRNCCTAIPNGASRWQRPKYTLDTYESRDYRGSSYCWRERG